MAWGDRERILNCPNEGINRGDINPDTLIRRIIPGTGILLSGTGVGDETIMAASPTVFTTRTISTGTGLLGGGDLSANRTLYAASPAVIWDGVGTITEEHSLVLSATPGFVFQLAGTTHATLDATGLALTAGSRRISLRDEVEWIATSTTAAHWAMAGKTFVDMDIQPVPVIGGASIYRLVLGEDVGLYGDTSDYLHYSRTLNAWLVEIGDAEAHYFDASAHALKRVDGNIRVGLRKTGTTSKLQFRDEETAEWLDLDDFALKSLNLTAGTGLVGGGNLAADRTFHVGAGTGIATNLDAVMAASPVIWWHENAATPSIHEIRPLTSSTTARLGYDSTDKRWWLGTGEQYEIMQADAGTMVVSASYGLRLAGPALRYLSFDTGNDYIGFMVMGATGDYRFMINNATVARMTRAATAGIFHVDEVRAAATTLALYSGAGSPGLFISGDGKVGVRTINPYSTLHVKSDSNNFAITVEEESGGEEWQIGVNAQGDLTFHDSQGATPVMFFQDATNNVAIGNQSPGARLSLEKSSGNILGLLATGDWEFNFNVQTSSAIGFGTSSYPTTMVWTTGGNVGIGTTAPAHPLSVAGKANFALTGGSLTVADVSASGTLTGASGYIVMWLAGATRYIPCYTAVA